MLKVKKVAISIPRLVPLNERIQLIITKQQKKMNENL